MNDDLNSGQGYLSLLLKAVGAILFLAVWYGAFTALAFWIG